MAIQNKLFYQSPVEGFLPVSIDGTDYYGYQNMYGNWYIKKVTATTVGYVYGSTLSDYATAWTARTSQTYVGPSVAFPFTDIV